MSKKCQADDIERRLAKYPRGIHDEELYVARTLRMPQFSSIDSCNIEYAGDGPMLDASSSPDSSFTFNRVELTGKGPMMLRYAFADPEREANEYPGRTGDNSNLEVRIGEERVVFAPMRLSIPDPSKEGT